MIDVMENRFSIDLKQVNFVIVSQNDMSGKTSFSITCSLGVLRFKSMSSVLDFIDMNKDIGFIV